ncbi:MAG TPA: RluA family pseudouridine synthase [Steroidobacteraceae bacterium]|nr:RluA family pseudouridine synthase [Steroidobacteraceae bacterium]
MSEDQAGVRLDNFLTRLLAGVPRSRIFRIVRRGEVRVNGKRASPETRLQVGDSVRVPPVSLPSPDAPAAPARVPRTLIETVRDAIINENERLIVLNKPAGIAVHGGSGLSFGIIEALRAARPEETLELVHRLDRDTSGCLLVARKPAALRVLHALLREGQVEKGYLALVKGQWDLGKKRIDVPLNTETRLGGERTVRVQAGGKSAVSTFSPVQFFRNRASLVEVDLDTGRTHQIRVHAAHVGHPVAGDEKYGDKDFNARMREEGLERMFLHSHRISFDWPNGGDFSASAPLPADLAAVLDALGESTSAKSARRRR